MRANTHLAAPHAAVAKAAVAAERAHRREAPAARIAQEVAVGVTQRRRRVPRTEARGARGAQRLRPGWPGPLARALVGARLAPAAPPRARIAEALVPAQRADRVELARARLAHVLAVVVDRGRAIVPVAVAARARGAQRLRAARPGPLARALVQPAVAPRAAPRARVAEALVPAQRAGRGEEALAVGARELAVLVRLRQGRV